MNICKNCKHCRVNPLCETEPLCVCPALPNQTNPVTGEPKNNYCSTERAVGQCDFNGYFFEPISAPSPSQTGAVELPPVETAARD